MSAWIAATKTHLGGVAVGKSARLLGPEFGRNAAEMNALLKEHGYLTGEPGAYGLTEKGAQYGAEQEKWNGYGGYAQRAWTTRTWDDGVIDALRADMAAEPAAAPSAPRIGDRANDEAAVVEPVDDWDYGYEPKPYEPQLSDRQAAAFIGVVVAVVIGRRVAPHVKPLWHEKVKPVAGRVRSRFTRDKADEVVAGDEVEPQRVDVTSEPAPSPADLVSDEATK